MSRPTSYLALGMAVCVGCLQNPWPSSNPGPDDCPDGHILFDGECALICQEDWHCESPQLCNDAGVCVDQCEDTADCTSPGPCETDATCSDGACIWELAPEGTDCDDDDPDTLSSACTAAGVCLGEQPECGSHGECDDSNPCTVDICTIEHTCTRQPEVHECNNNPACIGESVCSCYPSEDSETTCDDQVDNDCDDEIDCDDPNCAGDPCGLHGQICSLATPSACICPGGTTETACQDSSDNDCDGLEDCDDGDCTATDPSCECVAGEPGTELTCDDGVDNDCADGPDCADSDCLGQSCATDSCPPFSACDYADVCDEAAVRTRTCEPQICLADTTCGDGTSYLDTENCTRDQNGSPCGANGELCLDGSCDCPGTSEVCDDEAGDDEDCNGWANCEDSANCPTDTPCGPRGETCDTGQCRCHGTALPVTQGEYAFDCHDSTDNDCNGATDCDDGDCTANDIACTCTADETPTELSCDDSRDNNCARGADCLDSDCLNDECAADRCGGYGSCTYDTACDESADRSRTCYPQRCAGNQTCGDQGSYQDVDTGCATRNTDGQGCGTYLVCSSGGCVECGDLTEPCCTSNSCKSGAHTCSSGTCVCASSTEDCADAGNLDEDCSGSSNCADTDSCPVATVCNAGGDQACNASQGCVACGDVGEPCCGATCSTGRTCDKGACVCANAVENCTVPGDDNCDGVADCADTTNCPTGARCGTSQVCGTVQACVDCGAVTEPCCASPDPQCDSGLMCSTDTCVACDACLGKTTGDPCDRDCAGGNDGVCDSGGSCVECLMEADCHGTCGTTASCLIECDDNLCVCGVDECPDDYVDEADCADWECDSGLGTCVANNLQAEYEPCGDVYCLGSNLRQGRCDTGGYCQTVTPYGVVVDDCDDDNECTDDWCASGSPDSCQNVNVPNPDPGNQDATCCTTCGAMADGNCICDGGACTENLCSGNSCTVTWQVYCTDDPDCECNQ